VAKEALDSGRGVYDIVRENGLLTRQELDRLLNPEAMTGDGTDPAPPIAARSSGSRGGASAP
jgi:aspartate ammonia-lyase